MSCVHELNKITYPVRTSFSLYYTEAAGANGSSRRCYFQIKKINVNASLVLHEIPSPLFYILRYIIKPAGAVGLRRELATVIMDYYWVGNV